MTKTKAKTAKTASKKPAAKKAASAKTKPAAKRTAATRKSPANKSNEEPRAPKAAVAEARPRASASAASKIRPKVVVAAHESKAAPTRAEAQQPTAKPAADFGAGLASTHSHAAKPAPVPAAVAAPAALDAADTSEVATYLRNCGHARAADFAQVRKLILEVSSSIEEGIKWNAPSFRTTEWFATFHLRDPDTVAIVFHLGSTKRDNQKRVPVGAPEGMVEWLATDRCMVTVDDVKRRGKALQAFVRSWILHV